MVVSFWLERTSEQGEREKERGTKHVIITLILFTCSDWSSEREGRRENSKFLLPTHFELVTLVTRWSEANCCCCRLEEEEEVEDGGVGQEKTFANRTANVTFESDFL